MSFASPVAIASMFPDEATIEVLTQDVDDEGTVFEEWNTVSSAVPAQLSPAGVESELRTGEGSFEVRHQRLILYGWYPEADESARVTIGERIFDVRGIEPDSWGTALAERGWTVLFVEERQGEEGS